jgi:hypothetical protein
VRGAEGQRDCRCGGGEDFVLLGHLRTPGLLSMPKRLSLGIE